jgi:hypothetical protein
MSHCSIRRRSWSVFLFSLVFEEKNGKRTKQEGSQRAGS